MYELMLIVHLEILVSITQSAYDFNFHMSNTGDTSVVSKKFLDTSCLTLLLQEYTPCFSRRA